LEHLKGLTQRPSDFSIEVIPELLGRIQTWHTEGRYMDIGTPETLRRARKAFNTQLDG